MQQEIRHQPRFGKTLAPDDFDEGDLSADPAPARTVGWTVRPRAGPTRLRRRHVLIAASFVLAVLVPVAALTWYMLAVATPQFASSVAFNVRSEEAVAPAGSVLGYQVDILSVTDADILNAFITSQTLVERIDAELDIRTAYARPADDVLFRFDPAGTIEDLVSYWGRMVRVASKKDLGLIEVEVRAFDPDEAQAIAAAILRHSEAMINRLSQQAEEDTTRYARAELERAELRLRTARQALTRYRSENQIVDPEAAVAAQMGLLTSLQQRLANTLVEYDLLQNTIGGTDPRLEQARRVARQKIEVIERRIAEEKRKLGSGAQDAMGEDRLVIEIVGRFEELRVDLEFAEQSYLTARRALDGALENVRRKSRYLATYKPPTLAEKAQYPDTPTIVGLTALFLFLIWALLSLVAYSIRDRR